MAFTNGFGFLFRPLEKEKKRPRGRRHVRMRGPFVVVVGRCVCGGEKKLRKERLIGIKEGARASGRFLLAVAGTRAAFQGGGRGWGARARFAAALRPQSARRHGGWRKHVCRPGQKSEDGYQIVPRVRPAGESLTVVPVSGRLAALSLPFPLSLRLCPSSCPGQHTCPIQVCCPRGQSRCCGEGEDARSFAPHPGCFWLGSLL